MINQYLERYGYEVRIDVRSYAEQGIDQIPTIHLGPYAHWMKQQGIYTERWEINQEIEEGNRKLKEIAKEIALLEKEWQRLQSEAHSLVGHYERIKEEIRKTAEELGHRLSDRGRDIPAQQQKNVERVLEQLQEQRRGTKPLPTTPRLAHPAGSPVMMSYTISDPRDTKDLPLPTSPRLCTGIGKTGILPGSGCVSLPRGIERLLVIPQRRKRNGRTNPTMTGCTIFRQPTRRRSRSTTTTVPAWKWTENGIR